MPFERGFRPSFGANKAVLGLLALALGLLLSGLGEGETRASVIQDRPGNLESEIPIFAGGTPPYADTDFLDGRLRPAVGVHNFKVIRANRTHPDWVTRDLPYYPDAGCRRTGRGSSTVPVSRSIRGPR